MKKDQQREKKDTFFLAHTVVAIVSEITKMTTPFAPNQRVVITGLKSRLELNGKIGYLGTYLESGRVQITTSEGESLSLKPENLNVVVDDEKTSTVVSCTQMQQLVWQSIIFFYAFGNTPAKLLTRHFPAERPLCKALLLGCGDPRNVFFTLWTHLKSRSAYRMTCLDVTMCDNEPAILARNVVLFKLILNDEHADRLWCLFYAQNIDQVCIDVLSQCANDLLSVGGDLATWHATPFGTLIRFCDQRTYDLVREIWMLYAKGRLDAAEEKAKKQSRMEFLASKNISLDSHLAKKTSTTKNVNVILDTMLHVHPFVLSAMKDSDMHMDVAKMFYREGKAPSSIYTPTEATHFLNPMILRGKGQKHDLHYCLDPTMGFHKSMMYLKTAEGPLHSTDARVGHPDEALVYSVCFRQFREWNDVFREAVAAHLVVIRSHCGDAFAFCDMLADIDIDNRNAFRCPYTLQAVTVLPDVPRVYDVIDTSNVSDTTGLLSMLCMTHRLLSPHYGALFTGMMTTVSDEKEGLAGLLTQELRIDLTTFMALTNLNLIDSYNFHSANYGDYMDAATAGRRAKAPGSSQGMGIKSFRNLEWRIGM